MAGRRKNMDKLIAVVVLILVTVILAAGETYFRLERFRAKAGILLESIDLEPWFSHVRSVFSVLPDDSQAEYLALLRDYAGTFSGADRGRVALANQLQALAKKKLADHLDNGIAVAAAKLATGAWLTEAQAAGMYNEEVRKLNRSLSRTLSGVIGRLFRFRPMEELRDLSLL